MPKRVRPSELTARLHRREAAAAAELEARLKDAQRAIAARIETAAERRSVATSVTARERIYDDIADQYETLNEGIDDWLHDLTEKTAREWHGVAISEIQKQRGKRRLALAFDRGRVRRYWEIVHPDNDAALAAVFTDKMQQSDIRHLRSAFLDTFRQQTLEGWTAKQTHKELQARWDASAKNLRGDRFVDAGGRTWANAEYLQMLTRTTLQTVHREAYTDTLLENGFDLARISDDGDPCKVCQAWAGVIVSLTGKTPGYPTLQQARDSGWRHPNCMCRPQYLDETVDADEIARQRQEKPPAAPDLDPGDPQYREKLNEYIEAQQERNDELRIQAKMDDGMTADEADVDLKRDKLAAQMRHAFPDREDPGKWIDEIPDEVLRKMERTEIPRIEPAKRGDTPNSSRDSSLGGVLKLGRTASDEERLRAFLELEEKRGIVAISA